MNNTGAKKCKIGMLQKMAGVNFMYGKRDFHINGNHPSESNAYSATLEKS